jgi:hypothetical protein
MRSADRSLPASGQQGANRSVCQAAAPDTTGFPISDHHPVFGNVNTLTVEPNLSRPALPEQNSHRRLVLTGLDDLLKKSEPLLEQTRALLETVQKSAEAAAKITNNPQTQRDLS